MSEEAEVKIEQKEEETGKNGKKPFFTENRIEVLVAIFLGITAVLTAWASWIGSLHGGNQATNYTKSNNLAAEGNSEYNAGMQLYMSDLLAWNTYMEYVFDEEIAELNGNMEEAELIEEKMELFWEQNGSEILFEAFNEMTDDMNSPFEVEGMMERYTETANELLAESQEILEEGQSDNSNGDAFNLVNVIYSIVLFMLGIVGIFKKIPNRKIVLIISVVIMLIATFYMMSLPMPTGFSLGSFFE